MEERKNRVQDALQQTREMLRMEREKWEMERGALSQVSGERDVGGRKEGRRESNAGLDPGLGVQGV
jgi:hypothetical protein